MATLGRHGGRWYRLSRAPTDLCRSDCLIQSRTCTLQQRRRRRGEARLPDAPFHRHSEVFCCRSSSRNGPKRWDRRVISGSWAYLIATLGNSVGEIKGGAMLCYSRGDATVTVGLLPAAARRERAGRRNLRVFAADHGGKDRRPKNNGKAAGLAGNRSDRSLSNSPRSFGGSAVKRASNLATTSVTGKGIFRRTECHSVPH